MIHLNHASQAVLPMASATAAKNVFDRYAAMGSLPIPFWEELVACARRRAAALLGVEKDTVIFVPNTTAGVHLAMQIIPFQNTDRVLIAGAFPALIAPWKFGGVQGVDPVFLEWDSPGRVMAQAETHLKRGGVRAVFVDWVHFATGRALDLPQLRELTTKHGALLVIDAIQGLGVLPSPAPFADVCFAGSAKWLLGPEGIGLCYVNPEQTWNTGPVGWFSTDYDKFASVMPPRPPACGARRLEAGTRNLAGIAAFSESLKILLDAGEILTRVFPLAYLLIEGARNLDLPTSLQTPESGIVGIEVPNPETTAQRLAENGIRVSAREQWIRVSPHFFNTEEEIAIFFDALTTILNASPA